MASPSVMIIIFRQPGANIIDTVDRVIAALPQLQASIPAGDQDVGRARSHDDHSRLGRTTSN